MSAPTASATVGPRTASRPRTDYRAASELRWALIAGLALAVVMFSPIPLHLERDVLHDPLDPKLQAWEMAWNAHAFLSQPFHFWQANMYWPNADVLAFSDALVGYLPLGLLGELVGGGPKGALLGYNLACLVAFSVAFAGPYLLGRELGLPRAAAMVAGIVYAWSPWRWPQTGHLHIVSCGAMIVAVALLLRGYRRGRPRAVLGGWLFFAWQLLIGVSIGLQALYLVFLLACAGAVVWWRGDRPRPSREVIRATIVGLGLTALVLLWMGVPYLRVRHDHPEVVRTIEDIRFLSPPVKGLLAPSPDNLLWGRALADNRGGLRWPPEMLLFPGFAMFVLAVPGLIGGWFSRRLRIGLLVAGVLTLIFALGTTIDDGNFTYKLLFDYAPGWDGPRTPGRLLVIATLPFALLAGAGVAYLGDLAARVRRAPRWAPVAVCGLAGLYGLAEGSHWQTDVPGPGLVAGPQHLAVPARPAALSTAKAPVLHLPPTEPDSYDYILWSTADWKPIVNGLSGFQPTGTGVLYSEIGGFPDAASVAALRAFHVNTVVVYPDRIVNTPYADVLSRDVRGLGVRRRVQDGIVFFDLQP